jgi:excisionase family DNA binding protein
MATAATAKRTIIGYRRNGCPIYLICGASPPLISIGAAAEQIAVSKRTIRRMIADGRLTGYRVGSKMIRLDVDELRRLARPIPTAAPYTAPSIVHESLIR